RLDHLATAEAAGVLLRERHAYQAAAVLGDEIDLVRRDEFGGEDEVALVLAVLVIDQDHDPPGADLGDDLGDRAYRCGFAAHKPILLLFAFALGAARALTVERRLDIARALVVV